MTPQISAITWRSRDWPSRMRHTSAMHHRPMDISLARSSYEGKKVDGIFITKLLKADAETKDIPVLLATAHAMYGDREKFLADTGAEGYLSKPIHDPDAFLREVQSVVKKP